MAISNIWQEKKNTHNMKLTFPRVIFKMYACLSVFILNICYVNAKLHELLVMFLEENFTQQLIVTSANINFIYQSNINNLTYHKPLSIS